ncbi:hypothetical protein BOX15_Mlig029515g1, partial [Macrostomum lignano]
YFNFQTTKMSKNFSESDKSLLCNTIATIAITANSDSSVNSGCKVLSKHLLPLKPYDWVELYKTNHNANEVNAFTLTLSTKKVFLDNLLESTTRSLLRNHLASHFGPLSSLHLMRRNRGGGSRLTGSAIAEFASPQSATSCLAAEPPQLTIHGSPCPLLDKDPSGCGDGGRPRRRRCNLLRASPFYEKAIRETDPSPMESVDPNNFYGQDDGEEAEDKLAVHQRRAEHANQCLLFKLNPMAFRAILERLDLKDWFRLLEVCSCTHHRVRLALTATRQFRLDGSLFRRGFPVPSPPLNDSLCMRLLGQLSTTLTCLTVNLADYSQRSISGKLLIDIARQFPALESLELVPVQLSAADCRSAGIAGLQRLARLRLLMPPPEQRFVASRGAYGGLGFSSSFSSGYGDWTGDECRITEDGLWHLLKTVGPRLEELRVPAAGLSGKCFHFLTDRLTILELVGVVSPRVLRRLTEAACCRSLRCLLVVAAPPSRTPAGCRLADWLDWQPSDLYARLPRLCIADFAGRGVSCSARHVELPVGQEIGYFGRRHGDLGSADIGQARRGERWLSVLTAFTCVSCLVLTDTSVDDQCLQAVSQRLSSSLQALCLTHCTRISASGFCALAECSKLRRLRVSCTQFDLGVSTRLPPPGLQELAVASCHRLGQPVQPGVLRRFLALRQLVSLDLSFCVGLPTADEIADCLRRTDSVAAAAKLTIYCRGVSVPIAQEQLDSMNLNRPVEFNNHRYPSSSLTCTQQDGWSNSDWTATAAQSVRPMCLPTHWVHPTATEAARQQDLEGGYEHYVGEFDLIEDEHDFDFDDTDDEDYTDEDLIDWVDDGSDFSY